MDFLALLRGLLAPPALQLVLVLAGLWCLHRKRRSWGRTLIALGLGSLWLLAAPMGADLLARGLARDAVLNAQDRESWQQARAIVVLGGGRDTAPEFAGQDMPNYWTASRLRYGAWLYRHTSLPVLVSGGIVANERESEAAVMARSLQQDYVVNVRWQEGGSRTTWENAQLTQKLLAAEGIDHIILVTQGMHMWRARMTFEHAGLRVVPAPVDTGNPARLRPWPQRLVPSAFALMRSSQALHEYGGLVFYRLRMLWD